MSEEEDDNVQATFRASAQKIESMVNQSAIVGRGDPYHGDLYMNIGDGEVRTIAGSQGNVVVSYDNYNDSHLDEITGDCEAVIDVGDFLNYLDIATDGGMVDIKFIGSEDQRLAQQLTIDGKLHSTIMLPGSKAVLEEVPLGLPKQFNDDNVMVNGDGDALITSISTNTAELETIVDAVDLREDVDFFPIVVENGRFRLDVGDEKSQEIRGSLKATVQRTDGEEDEEVVDIDNRYNEGFEELVNTLSGDISLYTSPEAPLCLVQEKSGAVTRHSVGNVG